MNIKCTNSTPVALFRPDLSTGPWTIYLKTLKMNRMRFTLFQVILFSGDPSKVHRRSIKRSRWRLLCLCPRWLLAHLPSNPWAMWCLLQGKIFHLWIQEFEPTLSFLSSSKGQLAHESSFTAFLHAYSLHAPDIFELAHWMRPGNAKINDLLQMGSSNICKSCHSYLLKNRAPYLCMVIAIILQI